MSNKGVKIFHLAFLFTFFKYPLHTLYKKNKNIKIKIFFKL